MKPGEKYKLYEEKSYGPLLSDHKREARELEEDAEKFRAWLEPAMDELRDVYLGEGKFSKKPTQDSPTEVAEVEPSVDPKPTISPWRHPEQDMGKEPFPDEAPGVTYEDLAIADERQWRELEDQYGSREGAEKALAAKKKHYEDRHQEEMSRGGYGNQPWETGDLDLADYAQSMQDVGDAIGKVPHPVTSAVGSGMYTAGAAMGGNLYEAIGGLAGFGFGRLAKPLAESILASSRYKGLVAKYGPDVADTIASQVVQEFGEYLQKLTDKQDQL